MSILIKGMKMPKKCEQCWFFGTDSARVGYCYLLKGELPLPDGVPQDCPLVEVPTPHGPLVDSNRLIDIGLHLMHTAKNDDIANGVKWLWQYIIEAPTIIEGEGEDESR